MPILRDAILLAHLLGFALVVGGCLVQVRAETKQVNGAMVVGTIAQFVTGVGIVVAADRPPDNWYRLGVELAIWALLTVLVLANRRWETIPRGVWILITILALAESAVATLWR